MDGGGCGRSGGGASSLDMVQMTDEQHPGQSKHLLHLFFFSRLQPSNVVLDVRTMRTHDSSLISTRTEPGAAGRAEQPTPCCQIFARRKTALHLHPVLLSIRETSSHSSPMTGSQQGWLQLDLMLQIMLLFSWQSVDVCCVSTWKCLFSKMFFSVVCPVSTEKRVLIPQISHKRIRSNRLVHCTRFCKRAIWLPHWRTSHQKRSYILAPCQTVSSSTQQWS